MDPIVAMKPNIPVPVMEADEVRLGGSRGFRAPGVVGLASGGVVGDATVGDTAGLSDTVSFAKIRAIVCHTVEAEGAVQTCRVSGRINLTTTASKNGAT
jgi:hypothetical protein